MDEENIIRVSAPTITFDPFGFTVVREVPIKRKRGIKQHLNYDERQVYHKPPVDKSTCRGLDVSDIFRE